MGGCGSQCSAKVINNHLNRIDNAKSADFITSEDSHIIRFKINTEAISQQTKINLPKINEQLSWIINRYNNFIEDLGDVVKYLTIKELSYDYKSNAPTSVSFDLLYSEESKKSLTQDITNDIISNSCQVINNDRLLGYEVLSGNNKYEEYFRPFVDKAILASELEIVKPTSRKTLKI